jgi:hypothetical protein
MDRFNPDSHDWQAIGSSVPDDECFIRMADMIGRQSVPCINPDDEYSSDILFDRRAHGRCHRRRVGSKADH